MTNFAGLYIPEEIKLRLCRGCPQHTRLDHTNVHPQNPNIGGPTGSGPPQTASTLTIHYHPLPIDMTYPT